MYKWQLWSEECCGYKTYVSTEMGTDYVGHEDDRVLCMACGKTGYLEINGSVTWEDND